MLRLIMLFQNHIGRVNENKFQNTYTSNIDITSNGIRPSIYTCICLSIVQVQYHFSSGSGKEELIT